MLAFYLLNKLSVAICAIRQTLLEWSKKEWQEGWKIHHLQETTNTYKTFVWKSGMKSTLET